MSHGEVDCCSSAVTPASIVSEFQGVFPDCLVAALAVRRTTEDDGITAR